MKHPTPSVLQDYFENELGKPRSALVGEHLLDCESCTRILSQMAKADTFLRPAFLEQVTEQTKERIWADARMILKEKREKSLASNLRSRKWKDWALRAKSSLEEGPFELKIPILQLASLSFVIGLIIASEQTEQIAVKESLPGEVRVFTRMKQEQLPEGDLE